MTVYADILILVNFTVDYFLLALTSRFLNKSPRLLRLILGAAAGGVFSLYIFLPQINSFIEIAVHVFMCAAMCLITFKMHGIKDFFRSTAVLFAVNFAYSGGMIALWYAFKPYGMIINNSIVYFNISPIFLTFFSLLGYFLVLFFRKIFKKPFTPNAYCSINVTCCGNNLSLSGIVDTGNSLKDVFGISQIFITEYSVINKILGDEVKNPVRMRKIPCKTVTGEKLLDGFRIDGAEIVFNKRKYTFKNPVLAVSAVPIDDCKIIINPESLN